MKKETVIVVSAGAAVGLAAIFLMLLGNPANMGFCIACFLRDIAGACVVVIGFDFFLFL